MDAEGRNINAPDWVSDGEEPAYSRQPGLRPGRPLNPNRTISTADRPGESPSVRWPQRPPEPTMASAVPGVAEAFPAAAKSGELQRTPFTPQMMLPPSAEASAGRSIIPEPDDFDLANGGVPTYIKPESAGDNPFVDPMRIFGGVRYADGRIGLSPELLTHVSDQNTVDTILRYYSSPGSDHSDDSVEFTRAVMSDPRLRARRDFLFGLADKLEYMIGKEENGAFKERMQTVHDCLLTPGALLSDNVAVMRWLNANAALYEQNYKDVVDREGRGVEGIANAFYRGAYNLGDWAFGTVPDFFAKHSGLMSDDTWLTRRERRRIEAEGLETRNPSAVSSIRDVGSVMDFVQYFGNVSAEQLPNFAISAELAKLGVAGAKHFDAGEKATRVAGFSGFLFGSAILNLGETLDTAYAEADARGRLYRVGANGLLEMHEDAPSFGSIALEGALRTGIEMAPFGVSSLVLRGIARPTAAGLSYMTGRSVAAGVLRATGAGLASAVGEGSEEAGQTWTGRFFNYMRNESLLYKSQGEKTVTDALLNDAEEFAAGAFGSLVMTGGETAKRAGAERRFVRKADELLGRVESAAAPFEQFLQGAGAPNSSFSSLPMADRALIAEHFFQAAALQASETRLSALRAEEARESDPKKSAELQREIAELNDQIGRARRGSVEAEQSGSDAARAFINAYETAFPTAENGMRAMAAERAANADDFAMGMRDKGGAAPTYNANAAESNLRRLLGNLRMARGEEVVPGKDGQLDLAAIGPGDSIVFDDSVVGGNGNVNVALVRDPDGNLVASVWRSDGGPMPGDCAHEFYSLDHGAKGAEADAAALNDAISFANDLSVWSRWERGKYEQSPMFQFVQGMAQRANRQVVVYRTASDLANAGIRPGGKASELFDSGAPGGVSDRVNGMTLDGKIYLNAAKMTNPLEAAAVMFHEQIHDDFGRFVKTNAKVLAERFGIPESVMDDPETFKRLCVLAMTGWTVETDGETGEVFASRPKTREELEQDRRSAPQSGEKTDGGKESETRPSAPAEENGGKESDGKNADVKKADEKKKDDGRVRFSVEDEEGAKEIGKAAETAEESIAFIGQSMLPEKMKRSLQDRLLAKNTWARRLVSMFSNRAFGTPVSEMDYRQIADFLWTVHTSAPTEDGKAVLADPVPDYYSIGIADVLEGEEGMRAAREEGGGEAPAGPASPSGSPSVSPAETPTPAPTETPTPSETPAPTAPKVEPVEPPTDSGETPAPSSAPTVEPVKPSPTPAPASPPAPSPAPAVTPTEGGKKPAGKRRLTTKKKGSEAPAPTVTPVAPAAQSAEPAAAPAAPSAPAVTPVAQTPAPAKAEEGKKPAAKRQGRRLAVAKPAEPPAPTVEHKGHRLSGGLTPAEVDAFDAAMDAVGAPNSTDSEFDAWIAEKRKTPLAKKNATLFPADGSIARDTLRSYILDQINQKKAYFNDTYADGDAGKIRLYADEPTVRMRDGLTDAQRADAEQTLSEMRSLREAYVALLDENRRKSEQKRYDEVTKGKPQPKKKPEPTKKRRLSAKEQEQRDKERPERAAKASQASENRAAAKTNEQRADMLRSSNDIREKIVSMASGGSNTDSDLARANHAAQVFMGAVDALSTDETSAGKNLFTALAYIFDDSVLAGNNKPMTFADRIRIIGSVPELAVPLLSILSQSVYEGRKAGVDVSKTDAVRRALSRAWKDATGTSWENVAGRDAIRSRLEESGKFGRDTYERARDRNPDQVPGTYPEFVELALSQFAGGALVESEADANPAKDVAGVRIAGGEMRDAADRAYEGGAMDDREGIEGASEAEAADAALRAKEAEEAKKNRKGKGSEDEYEADEEPMTSEAESSDTGVAEAQDEDGAFNPDGTIRDDFMRMSSGRSAALALADYYGDTTLLDGLVKARRMLGVTAKDDDDNGMDGRASLKWRALSRKRKLEIKRETGGWEWIDRFGWVNDGAPVRMTKAASSRIVPLAERMNADLMSILRDYRKRYVRTGRLTEVEAQRLAFAALQYRNGVASPSVMGAIWGYSGGPGSEHRIAVLPGGRRFKGFSIPLADALEGAEFDAALAANQDLADWTLDVVPDVRGDFLSLGEADPGARTIRISLTGLAVGPQRIANALVHEFGHIQQDNEETWIGGGGPELFSKAQLSRLGVTRHSAYERIGGEVMSRALERRRGLTMEQRLGSLLGEEMAREVKPEDMLDPVEIMYENLHPEEFGGGGDGARVVARLAAEDIGPVQTGTPMFSSERTAAIADEWEREHPLMAVHGMSLRSLKKALDAGAFIMPSIAVKRHGRPWLNAGYIDEGMKREDQVFVLFDRPTVERSDMFEGDAFTPTIRALEGTDMSDEAIANVRDKWRKEHAYVNNNERYADVEDARGGLYHAPNEREERELRAAEETFRKASERFDETAEIVGRDGMDRLYAMLSNAGGIVTEEIEHRAVDYLFDSVYAARRAIDAAVERWNAQEQVDLWRGDREISESKPWRRVPISEAKVVLLDAGSFIGYTEHDRALDDAEKALRKAGVRVIPVNMNDNKAIADAQKKFAPMFSSGASAAAAGDATAKRLMDAFNLGSYRDTDGTVMRDMTKAAMLDRVYARGGDPKLGTEEQRIDLRNRMDECLAELGNDPARMFSVANEVVRRLNDDPNYVPFGRDQAALVGAVLAQNTAAIEIQSRIERMEQEGAGDAELAPVRAERAVIMDSLANIERAVFASKKRQSLALNLNRVMIRDDWTAGGCVGKLTRAIEKAGGGTATSEDIEGAMPHIKKVGDTQRELSEATRKERRAKDDEKVRSAISGARREARRRGRGKSLSVAAAVARAKAVLAKRLERDGSFDPANYRQAYGAIRDLVKLIGDAIVAERVDSGSLMEFSLGEFSDRLFRECGSVFGEIRGTSDPTHATLTADDYSDMYGNVGRYDREPPKGMTDFRRIQKKMEDGSRLLGELRRVKQQGVIPPEMYAKYKTMKEVDEEIARLQREHEAAFRESGLSAPEERDLKKTPLDRVKETAEAEIKRCEDGLAAIARGERPEVLETLPDIKLDEAARVLKERAAYLRAALKNALRTQGLTDEQRIELLEKRYLGLIALRRRELKLIREGHANPLDMTSAGRLVRTTPEIEDLRRQLSDLMREKKAAELNLLPDEYLREKAIDRAIKAQQKREADYLRKTKMEDEGIDTTSARRDSQRNTHTKEWMAAWRKAEAAKAEFMTYVGEREFARKTLLGKIWSVGIVAPVQASRNIVAGFDLSSVLVQGGWWALGHPKDAVKALYFGLRSLLSSKYAAERTNAMMADEDFDTIYDKNKMGVALNLTGTAESMLGRSAGTTEVFVHNYALKKLGIFGENMAIRASERGFAAPLDYARFTMAKALLEKYRQLNGRNAQIPAEVLKEFGRIVNITTGKGDFWKHPDAGTNLIVRNLLWAPSRVSSQMQIATGSLVAMAIRMNARGQITPNMTGYLLKETLGKQVAGFFGFLMLAALLKAAMQGDDDDDKNLFDGLVEINPLSKNFGRINLGGYSVSATAGIERYLSEAAIVITGKQKRNTPEVKKDGTVNEYWNLRGDDRDRIMPLPAEDLVNFFLNKSPPLTSFVRFAVLNAKTPDGATVVRVGPGAANWRTWEEPTKDGKGKKKLRSITRVAAENFALPLSAADFVEAAFGEGTKDPGDRLLRILIGASAFAGANIREQKTDAARVNGLKR